MIGTILIGIASSYLAEFVTWINQKLQNTLLKGDGAFLLSLFAALVGGAVKVFYFDHVAFDLHNLTAITASFTEIWTISQVYFLFIMKKFSLDVKESGV